MQRYQFLALFLLPLVVDALPVKKDALNPKRLYELMRKWDEYMRGKGNQKKGHHKINRNGLEQETGSTSTHNFNNNLFEGDILLTQSQLEEFGKMKLGEVDNRSELDKEDPISPWGSIPVTYRLDNISSNATDALRLAIKFWEKHTCVRFIEDHTTNARVSVIAGRGCYSSVGNTGEQQNLSLPIGCAFLDTALHELGHTLGLSHTQARHDRDEYLALVTENIKDGRAGNFLKHDTSDYSFATPYEYGSIMHYASNVFSKNGKPTMVALDPSFQNTMGGPLPSFYDVLAVNYFNGCFKKCQGIHVRCENGGVQDVNDCSKCFCPEGYKGDKCEHLGSEGCTKQYSAIQTVNYFEDSAAMNFQLQYSTCTYLVVAPAGKVAKLRVESFDGHPIGKGNCTYAGIEVKTMRDARSIGTRLRLLLQIYSLAG